MPIRNVERDLYSKKSKFSNREHKQTSYNEWKKGEETIETNMNSWKQRRNKHAKKQMKATTIGIIIVIIIAIIGLTIISYSNYQKSFFNEDKVQFEVMMPDKIESNKLMEIEIEYKNNNRAILRNAKIELFYGQYFTPEKEQKYFLKSTNTSGIIKLGDIAPKSSGKVSVTGYFAAPQNDIESINLKLDYIPEKSRRHFIIENSASTRVTSAPVDINIITEKTAVEGNMADFIIKYHNKSSNDLENVILNMAYPKGFVFEHAEPNTIQGSNNTWSLGSLKAGNQGEIKLRGIIHGEGKKAVKFSANIYEKKSPGIFYGGTTYPIKITSSPLRIQQRAFVPGLISLNQNGGSGFADELRQMKDTGLIDWSSEERRESNVVYPGHDVRYVIYLKNEGHVPLKNIILTAKITGDVVDFNDISIDDNHYFDLNEHLITWKASDVPKLKTLNPGDSVSLEYGIRIKDFLPVGKNNFTVSTVAFADSLDLPTNIRENKNASSNVKVVKVGEKALFGGKIRYISGPNPPVRGQKTVYRVTLGVGSVNNDLNKVFVKGALPTNVEFVGQKEDDPDELDINRRTNLFSWNAGNIKHGTGITSDFKTISFDVNYLPNYSFDSFRDIVVVKYLMGYGYDNFAQENVFFGTDALVVSE